MFKNFSPNFALLSAAFLLSSCAGAHKTVVPAAAAPEAKAQAPAVELEEVQPAHAPAAKAGGTLTFHYTLTNAKGEVLDSSEGKEPLTVRIGAHEIIPGLEAELLKMKPGEKKKVVVPADQAYGPRYEGRTIQMPADKLPPEALKVGAQVSAGLGIVFTVTEIKDGVVTLDGNHPLAGQDLTFDVDLLSAS
ncbi:MAG TPA: FKBP-type peptidyl-prolyl cis-trans isomerase [Verrucomicrobiae bacterium]|nr:FKBP-type peptidyl-prolyl cis-trans isomerase [Verrucomicrobiae bacterium]